MRYEIVVCSGKWDTRGVFFVGMLGGNRQEMLGGNHLYVYFKGCGSPAHIFMDSPQYLLTLKHHRLIHHLLTAGWNSSLRARGRAGCWVEFHPASLSEGWNIDEEKSVAIWCVQPTGQCDNHKLPRYKWISYYMWPLLLTLFNFNPNMYK